MNTRQYHHQPLTRASLRVLGLLIIIVVVLLLGRGDERLGWRR